MTLESNIHRLGFWMLPFFMAKAILHFQQSRKPFSCLVSNLQKESWTGVPGISSKWLAKPGAPTYLPNLPGPGWIPGWRRSHWSYLSWGLPTVLPLAERGGSHTQAVSLKLPKRLSHKLSWNSEHTRPCWEILLCSEGQLLPGEKHRIYQWSFTKKCRSLQVRNLVKQVFPREWSMSTGYI